MKREIGAGGVFQSRGMKGRWGEEQRAACENEWDNRGIDSQVSERELTRGQKEGGEDGERGTEEVNNRTLAKCLGTGEWRRTKVETSEKPKGKEKSF